MGLLKFAQGVTQWDNRQQAEIEDHLAFFYIILIREKVQYRPSLSVYKQSLGICFYFIALTYLERSRPTQRGCTGACWELRSPVHGQFAPPFFPRASAHLSARKREEVSQDRWCHLVNSSYAQKRLRTWYSRTKMKMLSAPTASTRKGTTCRMTSEEGMPIQE